MTNFDQMRGKAKEAAGKMTGNDSMANKGRAEQSKGKAKETAKKAKETARETARDVTDRARDSYNQ
ncbi:CsbD family protein [Planomonospora parontospora]|uniref:CsbD family protein n=1 Tax=Planomonospora parontospora TaxID=58119 RepID=UPI001670CEDC|nr:CsbD family protein [Planomonospora parontospora]GGL24671.1 hypothetical protein GCM10014719_27890 [Planomonospora parontospora subsp. antibiotica]GII16434.1 hypothetical protein Ppa05_31600 [Planomonospora parontospora subsp. antibiotica]